MKYIFLIIFWSVAFFLVVWIYDGQIPTKNLVQYNEWLEKFQAESIKDKNLSNREFQILIFSNSSPELRWQIDQNTKDITSQKVNRVLNQLKIVGAFNNAKLDNNDDLIVQVKDNEKEFYGRIPMEEVKNNIRVQVLLQLLDAYK